jgi:hypothetical protein
LALAGDINADCEFEHHARTPTKAISHHAAESTFGSSKIFKP